MQQENSPVPKTRPFMSRKAKRLKSSTLSELWGSTLKTNGFTFKRCSNFIARPVGIQELPWFPEKWSFEKMAPAQWSCVQWPDGGRHGAPLSAVWEPVRNTDS